MSRTSADFGGLKLLMTLVYSVSALVSKKDFDLKRRFMLV